ncbi:MAG: hypothetical protein EBT38_05300 [Acidimicrobiia bacterium]|nr:hypothetical protein [Acidimicrobiia bacterium]
MTRIIVVDDLSRFALGGSEHLALADDVIVSWNTFSSASNIPVDAQVIHLGDALHDTPAMARSPRRQAHIDGVTSPLRLYEPSFVVASQDQREELRNHT